MDWLYIWIGVGFINALYIFFNAKEVFYGRKDEFSDEEFNDFMFVLVILSGPLGVAITLYGLVSDKKRNEAHAKIRAGWAEREESDRQERQDLKNAASELIDCNLERLLSEAELERHPEPRKLAEECIELGASARRLNLSSLSDEEKLKVIGLLKKVRINAGTLLEDLPPREQAMLSRKLSENLSKLQKKFRKALEK